MPTYEYRCKECGHELEVVQSFSDAPLTECAICGGQLRKVFSPVGVVLKGSGFYRTDSRSGNGKRAAKTGAGSGSDSGSDSGSGTATKTETGSGSGSSSDSGSSGSDSSSSSSTATKTD
jgi:putative FmdB family regulatory protein